MSNFEKIRLMSLDELAEWVRNVSVNCCICGGGCEPCKCPFDGNCPDSYLNGKIDKDFIEWFESEVDAS